MSNGPSTSSDRRRAALVDRSQRELDVDPVCRSWNAIRSHRHDVE